MKIGIASVAASVALVISGCATTVPSFTEKTAKMPPPQPGIGRIYIYRADESPQYSPGSARIYLDQKKIGDVAYQAFNVFDVSLGIHVLSIDAWGKPGSCKIWIDVPAKDPLYFEIKPRPENLTEHHSWGSIGAAIESGTKKCGGVLVITPTTQDAALPVITTLKATE